jgi:Tfp pilus assembly protein PilZ
MKERRAHPRLKAENKLMVTAQPPEGSGEAEYAFLCSTENISVGGLRFITKTPPAVGTRLNLKIFTEKQNQSFNLKGRVAWTAANGANKTAVGVQFSDSPIDELTAWRQMIEQKMTGRA